MTLRERPFGCSPGPFSQPCTKPSRCSSLLCTPRAPQINWDGSCPLHLCVTVLCHTVAPLDCGQGAALGALWLHVHLRHCSASTSSGSSVPHPNAQHTDVSAAKTGGAASVSSQMDHHGEWFSHRRLCRVQMTHLDAGGGSSQVQQSHIRLNAELSMPGGDPASLAPCPPLLPSPGGAGEDPWCCTACSKAQAQHSSLTRQNRQVSYAGMESQQWEGKCAADKIAWLQAVRGMQCAHSTASLRGSDTSHLVLLLLCAVRIAAPAHPTRSCSSTRVLLTPVVQLWEAEEDPREPSRNIQRPQRSWTCSPWCEDRVCSPKGLLPLPPQSCKREHVLWERRNKEPRVTLGCFEWPIALSRTHITGSIGSPSQDGVNQDQGPR